MKHKSNGNNANASERIGLLTMKATLKQFIAEGIEWEISGTPGVPGITISIPSFTMAKAADGRTTITEVEKDATPS